MVDQSTGGGSPERGHSRAAELAAQQVESIVAAAQAAGDQLRQEAERQAEEIRAAGQRDAERQLDDSRREAAALGEQARREADRVVGDARREADRLRQQTRRAVEGRVAAAEEASAQVLAEARALSTGLRRLGETLGDQGERILRDVQAAHRRMQADLRVVPAEGGAGPAGRRAPAREEDEAVETLRRALADEREEPADRGPSRSRGGSRSERQGERRNALEDLEVPDWVDRRR